MNTKTGRMAQAVYCGCMGFMGLGKRYCFHTLLKISNNTAKYSGARISHAPITIVISGELKTRFLISFNG